MLVVLSGCRTAQVFTFLGPRIGQCCMQVDDSIARAFSDELGEGVVRSEGGKSSIDIGEACAIQLCNAGVPRENIGSVDTCTGCGDGYFSFRASGGTCGRQMTLAVMDVRR